VKQWQRRVRSALVMGVLWALVWAPVAVLVGLLIDPDGSMDEMWPVVGAYPGFIGGVLFSVVLGIAARRRRFDELSIPRVAGWGALAGFLVGVLPFLLGEPTSAIPAWLLGLIVIGSLTVMSAASAAGSLALARLGTTRPAGIAGTGAGAPDEERGLREAKPAREGAR
jgi:hypothetical protein